MKIQEFFIQGGHWLYLRIYTGHKTADNILKEILHPVAEGLIKQKLAERWFFIRYADPEFHLRFRIKLKDTSINDKVLKDLREDLKSFMGPGQIWEIETAIYKPETERYGSLSMEYAEQLFCFDSEAFIDLMKIVPDSHITNARWLFALASTDRLLKDFKLSLEQKKDLLLDLNRNFGNEFGKDKKTAQQLSEKYRMHRGRIKSLLEKEDETTNMELINILDKRSESSQLAIRAILKLYESGKAEVSKVELLSSLIHMSMNRIFRNNNRMHEMVLYDFLFRYYKSELAMARTER